MSVAAFLFIFDMKKILYLFLIIVCVSCCKPEINNNTFTDVTLYYYGYSNMGYTYEVPLRFYKDGKVEAFFILYSVDKDLKSGVYHYNDVFEPNADTWNDTIVYSNFTFFKGKCHWGNNIITEGAVTVERKNDEYTFLICAIDNKGEAHIGKYQGKVKKQNFEKQSKIGGVFAAASLSDANDPWLRPIGLPSDYAGGATMVQVEAGERYDGYTVNMMYLHPDKNDPTGTYYVNPDADGYYHEGEIVYQNYCLYKLLITTWLDTKILASGTITITRVNKPWKFRIDVDVTDKEGGHIKGFFDGGEYRGDYD